MHTYVDVFTREEGLRRASKDELEAMEEANRRINTIKKRGSITVDDLKVLLGGMIPDMPSGQVGMTYAEDHSGDVKARSAGLENESYTKRVSGLSSDDYARTLCASYVRAMVMVGINDIIVDRTTVGDVDKYTCGAYSHFDGVPDDILKYSGVVVGHIADLLSTLGIHRIRVSLSEPELAKYRIMWGDTKVISSVEITSRGDEADRVSTDSNDSTVSNAGWKEAGTGSQITKEEAERIRRLADEHADELMLYDRVAKLLPLEGRDYTLEFVHSDDGGIAVNPKAKNEIGAMWCRFLKNNLQKYALMTMDEMDAALDGSEAAIEDNSGEGKDEDKDENENEDGKYKGVEAEEDADKGSGVDRKADEDGGVGVRSDAQEES